MGVVNLAYTKCLFMNRERFENIEVYVKELTLWVLFPLSATQYSLNTRVKVVIGLHKL